MSRLSKAEPVLKRRPDPDEQPLPVNGGAVNLAFDSLLRVARTVGGIGRGVEEKYASQLFEPPPVGDQKQRPASRQSEDRSARQALSADDQYDRTSVGARRTSGESRSGGTLAEAASARIASVLRRGDAAGSPSRSDNFALDRAAERVAGQRLGTGAARTANEAAGARTAEPAVPVPGSAGRVAPQVETLSPALRGQGSVTPVGAAGGANAKGPAQRVGQMLATGRVGGEAGRPTALVSASSGAAPATSARDPADRALNARPSRQEAASRSSGSSPADARGLERTPFDDLVRSIRLKNGPFQSSAKLQLEPPELGRLHVHVRVLGERVQIDIRTETEAARQLVRERGSKLIHALQLQGVSVDRFDVAVGLDADEASGSSGDEPADTATRRAQDEPYEESEDRNTRSGRPGKEEAAELTTGGFVRRTRIDIRV